MTNTALVSIAALKAANTCASTEQTRYYLCGVFLTVEPRRSLYVATNGHVLFAHCEDLDAKAEDNTLLGSWIVPADVIAKLKTKRGVEHGILSTIEGGRLLLKSMGGTETLIQPVDGSFPDWRRVCPRGIEEGDAVVRAQYNVELLAVFAKAAKALDWNTNSITLHTRGFGEPAAVTFGPGRQTFGVIMDLRSAETPGTWSGLPDWTNTPPAARMAAE